MPIGQKSRMYNAGDRLVDSLIYTVEDGHDPHCVARWSLDAPAQEFFDVPEVLLIRDMRISVHFTDTILRRFSDRGVVLIDKNWEAPTDALEADAIPCALDEHGAVAKGKKKWKDFYTMIARQHIEDCQNARAVNMPAVPAKGFTKRAMDLAGLTDPADAFIAAATAKTDDLADIKKTLAEQGALIQRQNETIQKLMSDKKGKAA